MLKTIREANVGDAAIRLLKTDKGYAGVVSVKGVVKAKLEDSDSEDLWRRLHDEAAKFSPSFFGFRGASARFLRIFKDGFASSDYLGKERFYKLAAKEKLDASVPLEAAMHASGLGEAVLSVFRATNLLSPFEKTRLQEALRGPHADQFIKGAAMFASGDTVRGLVEMQHALKPHQIAKWTAVTYLPFLWRPDVHMFLKPNVTNNFASRVGHTFAADYLPQPEPTVYASLLDLVTKTESEIAELNPRDRIDVQSFIWVVGEYDVDAEDRSI